MADVLDLEEIQQRPAIRKLRDHVQALTSRPVNFRHMHDWIPTHPDHPPELSSPAMHPTDSSYDVYLNETLTEQMAIHELLHIVLIKEGYPDIRFNAWKAPANNPHRRNLMDSTTI